MPVRTGTDRLAGLIPPFIHSFLKMPYPETDGIRYFLRLAPVCGGQPTQKGTAERLSPGGIAAGIGLTLAEALRKGHTHTEVAGLCPRVPSCHAESLWGHAADSGLPPGALPKAMRAKDGEPFPRGIAAESGLPLAKALQKGHTHTEAAGLRPRVLSRLL